MYVSMSRTESVVYLNTNAIANMHSKLRPFTQLGNDGSASPDDWMQYRQASMDVQSLSMEAPTQTLLQAENSLTYIFGFTCLRLCVNLTNLSIPGDVVLRWQSGRFCFGHGGQSVGPAHATLCAPWWVRSSGTEFESRSSLCAESFITRVVKMRGTQSANAGDVGSISRPWEAVKSFCSPWDSSDSESDWPCRSTKGYTWHCWVSLQHPVYEICSFLPAWAQSVRIVQNFN